MYSYEDFWNAVSLLSLIIGIINLDENISQTDMEELVSNANSETEKVLEDIQSELQDQKKLLTTILDKLEELQK